MSLRNPFRSYIAPSSVATERIRDFYADLNDEYERLRLRGRIRHSWNEHLMQRLSSGTVDGKDVLSVQSLMRRFENELCFREGDEPEGIQLLVFAARLRRESKVAKLNYSMSRCIDLAKLAFASPARGLVPQEQLLHSADRILSKKYPDNSTAGD